MTTGNSEHVAKGSLDPEDPTKYSDNPTENSGNHEETLLSRVESSLANQAVRDSERDVQQTPEDKEDTHTVAELLEILERERYVQKVGFAAGGGERVRFL